MLGGAKIMQVIGVMKNASLSCGFLRVRTVEQLLTNGWSKSGRNDANDDTNNDASR